MSRWRKSSPRPRRCRRPAEWKSPESSASLSQSAVGATWASSRLTSSESDTLEREEPPLVAGAKRAVAAEAARGDHAVARHEDAVVVLRAERAGRARRARRPCEGGVRPVGHDLAAGHLTHCLRARPLERRASVALDVDVREVGRFTREERAQSAGESFHEVVTDACGIFR